ncbi:hypothetical protein [Trichormus sp. NMC-1]|nr:hypothetical protein [Trichormus sp. NMC-1]
MSQVTYYSGDRTRFWYTRSLTTLILNDRTPTFPNSDSYGALRYRSQPP